MTTLTKSKVRVEWGNIVRVPANERVTIVNRLDKIRDITIVTGEGSEVDYLIVSDKKPDYDLKCLARPGKGSRFNGYFFGEMEGRHTIELKIEQTEEGSTGNLLVALKNRGKSGVRMELINHHFAPHTVGDIRFRGLGEDEAVAEIDGLIKIDLNAKYTSSHLYEDVLSLSPKSRVKAEPNLEILNNEVLCSHAAAVGSVDDEALHYLASRGLTPEQAKMMLKQGFLRVLLRYIENDEIKKELQQLIG